MKKDASVRVKVSRKFSVSRPAHFLRNLYKLYLELLFKRGVAENIAFIEFISFLYAVCSV